VTIEFRTVPWDDPAAAALREAQREEVRRVFYPELEESEPGPHPSADDIAVFYVAYDVGEDGGERPVATGGLRAIDDEHGEIKRMFVDPEYRGTGVSSGMVRTLEDDARARGWNRLVLETGDRMLAAQHFYQREGYAPIPAFGPYRWSTLSVCFGKRLT
jgi:GNAT superfamily N-acetyltransferase